MYEYFSYSQKRNQLMEMAHDSIVWNVYIGLCHCIFNLSNFSLMEWIQPLFNLASGISLMLFYAFAMQCMSTIAIVKKETNTWKWPMVQLFGMTFLAYIVAFSTYQILS